MSGYGDSPTLIPTNADTGSKSGTPPSSSNNTRSTDKSVTAIISTTSLVGVVMLIAIAVMGYKCIQKKRQNAVTSKESLIKEFSKEKPVRFTPRDLETFTQNYSHPLGSGGFGDVYKGTMYNRVPVAVKKLKKISDDIVNDQFTAELFSIGRTYHVNLVKLYGFCFTDKVKALVYEYMENGSLESCLNDKRKLDWETLHQIAVGTARGIRYLHEECHKVIIHYDIKPGNVLLSTDFSPKVADFGMAELWDRESTLQAVTLGRGTPGFIAPELSQTLPSTPKCDIYSFGMLLFQILGSRRIAEGQQADSQQKSACWVREKAEQGDFGSILLSCGIEEKDRVEAERMAKVALLCVQHQPEKRPSMSNVLGMLCVQHQPEKRTSMGGVLKMLEGEEKIGAMVSPFNIWIPSTIEGATTPSGPLLTEDSNITVFLENISKENTIRFSCQELKEITGNYTKELGRGRFGIVYEGRLKKCELLVAVKVLQGSGNSVEAQFRAEVGTMCRTHHNNLVRILGFCFDAEVKALVCEYMENGSLDHYLSGKKGPLEFEKVYEIAVGTARGIRYLHEDIECDKKIIHYDIKPGNVLLDRYFSPKVGDFGLAELLDWKATVPLISQGKGTLGFAAPEVAFCFTSKSDVYSFGMLLFQILVSRRITEGKRAESQLNLRRLWDNISKARVASILSLCGIEDENKEKAERMCRVALTCVRYQSETRPSMSSVLRMLEGEEEIGETVSPFNNQIWLPSQADQETEVSAGDYQPIESSSK